MLRTPTRSLLLRHLSPTAQGTEAIRETAEIFSALPGVQIDLSTTTIELSSAADMAYELAAGTVTTDGPDGEPVEDKIRDFHIWRKQADGSWKLSIDIWNSENPLPSSNE